MKKSLTLLLGLTCISSVASAEIVSNYSESFEGPSATPKGWIYTPYSSYSSGSSALVDGGHTGKAVELKQYSTYYSSYYNNYSYNDILVTPKVKGTVKLWVKKNDALSSLTVYQLSDQKAALPSQNALAWTGKSTSEADIRQEGTPTGWSDIEIGSWGEVTMEIPDYTYLAIRGDKIYVDDFTAATCDYVLRKELKFSLSNKPNSYTGIEADKNNDVTLNFTATITNVGDVDFGDGNAVLTITNTNLKKDFGTENWNVNIPFGGSVTKDFSITGKAELEEGTVSNGFTVTVTRTDFPTTLSESLGYLKIVPYKPVGIVTQAATGDKNAENALFIGIGKPGTKRTYYLRNTGIAPMNITNVKIEGDFATTLTAGKVDAKSDNAIDISMTGAPGHKKGKMTITSAELGDMTYDLDGVVTADGKFFLDFEDGTNAFTDGTIVSINWKVGSDNASMKVGDNTTWAYNSNYGSTGNQFILPKLKFEEGEKFYFLASKSNSSPKIEISISSDRNNFELIKTITHNAEDIDDRVAEDNPLGVSSRYNLSEWKVFELDVPAGEWYISFNGSYMRIDNLSGGQLVAVDHDLYVTDKAFSKTGNVNTRTNASVTVRNIAKTDETDYKIVLTADGKTVSELESYEDLKAGESLTYDFTYTPHALGVENIAFVYEKGDYKATLLSYDLTVNEEQAVEDHKVNEEKITMLDPIDTFYPYYQSEFILTANHLKLDKGSKLSSLKFLGYNTKNFKKHITVYVENTSATAFDRVWQDDEKTKLDHMVNHEFSEMTKVFEGDVEFEPCGNGSVTPKEYAVVFDVPFSESIVYNGESLCFAFDMVDVDPNHPCTDRATLASDNTEWINSHEDYSKRPDLDYMIRRTHDYVIEEQNWVRAGNVLPVVLIGVRKDIVELSGQVSDEFEAPVENAEVEFTAADNLYSSITDTEGSYKVTVMKPELTYNLTATADDFAPYTEDNFTIDIEQPYATKNITLIYSDRTANLSGIVTDTEGQPVNDAVVEATTESAEAVTAHTDSDGHYTLCVPEFKGDHNVKVFVDEIALANENHIFASKDDTHNFKVKISGIESVDTDKTSAVTVNGSTIIVSGVNDPTVELYSLTGALVAKAAVVNGEATFFNVAKGVYMTSAGNKVIVK